jgi:alcohol dehydrogenase, propanol-preferring
MMAWRLTEFGRPPQLQEVEIPRPAAGEVLVKVAGNGLCHSDVGLMDPNAPVPPFPEWRLPFTLGHEIAGWIEESGGGVTGFSAGQPVILVATHSDGTCGYCQAGLDNNCESGTAGRGYGRDGGLAPYVLLGNTRPLIALKTLDPRTAGPRSPTPRPRRCTPYGACCRASYPEAQPPSSVPAASVASRCSFCARCRRRA